MEITILPLVTLLLLVPGLTLLMAAGYFQAPTLNYVGLPAIVVGVFLLGLWSIQAMQSFG